MKKTLTLIIWVWVNYGYAQISSNCQFDAIVNDNPNLISDTEPDNFILDGRFWNKKILTYNFMNGTNDVSGTAEYQAVRDAFSIWQTQTNLLFLETCNSTEADIVISWVIGDHGDNMPFNAVNLKAGHAFFPPPNSGTLAGDIHFNDAINWVVNGEQGTSVKKLAIHEIGHSLGLLHSDNPYSVMFDSYFSYSLNLYQDDINAIQLLYGPPKPDFWEYTGPKQFCPSATYSIALKKGCTIEWSVTGPAIIAGASNLASVNLTANGNGMVYLKRAITYGCKTFNFTDTITIPKPAIASIVGANNLCTTESYNISNLPPGATLTWTASGAIQISGSNTTNPVMVTKTFDGTGTLTANMSSPCGNQTVSENIVTGIPKPYITTKNMSPPGSYTDFDFTASPFIEGATYNWYVNNILEYSVESNTFFWSTSCNISASISCVIISNCGISVKSSPRYMSGSCNEFGQFLIGPNPSNDLLTVSQKTTTGTEQLASNQSKNPFGIKLYDANGNLLKKGESKTGDDLTLDVSSIPNGTYFLHIGQGKDLIKKQVIIQH